MSQAQKQFVTTVHLSPLHNPRNRQSANEISRPFIPSRQINKSNIRILPRLSPDALKYLCPRNCQRTHSKLLQLIQKNRPFHNRDALPQRLLPHLPVPRILREPRNRTQMALVHNPHLRKRRRDVDERRLARGEDVLERHCRRGLDRADRRPRLCGVERRRGLPRIGPVRRRAAQRCVRGTFGARAVGAAPVGRRRAWRRDASAIRSVCELLIGRRTAIANRVWGANVACRSAWRGAWGGVCPRGRGRGS